MSAAAIALCQRHGCGEEPRYVVRTGALARTVCSSHLAWQVRAMLAGTHASVEVRLVLGEAGR